MKWRNNIMGTLFLIGLAIFFFVVAGQAVLAILGACFQIFGACFQLGFGFVGLLFVGGLFVVNLIF